VITLSAYVMIHVPGNDFEMTQPITNLLISPIFIWFFMALFVPFATSSRVIAGAVATSAAAVTVACREPLINSLGIEPKYWKAISFQWIQPYVLAVEIVVGRTASLLERWCKQNISIDEISHDE